MKVPDLCRGLLLFLSISVVLSCSGTPAEMRAKHMKRGDAFFEKQEFKKAIIEYRNSVKAEPKFAHAHYRLALTYLKANKFLRKTLLDILVHKKYRAGSQLKFIKTD